MVGVARGCCGFHESLFSACRPANPGQKTCFLIFSQPLRESSAASAFANELESDAVLDLECSDDVFVLGFPFGQIAGAPAPVWKRGTIALDPRFDPEGLPKLLVDTATREGMSGSVVLARQTVLGRDYLKKDGSRSEPILIGFLTVVVGIYSGRHYPDLEKAQLGIVWKRHVIEELVKERVLATA